MKSILILILFLTISFSAFGGTYSVVVIHTNDVHGGIDSTKAFFMNPEFPPEIGGGASAATLIQQTRDYCKETGKGFLLLDTGDIFQGTLVGTKTKGEAVMRYMNAVGYDAWVLGNHEFDLGRWVTEDLKSQAEFPTLSSNIYDTTDTGVKLYCQPYLIKQYGPIKVGIVGITTGGTVRQAFEDNIKNLYFGPEIPALSMYRDSLRAMGCDVVIAACHLGLPFDRWKAWDDLERWEKEGWKSDYARNAMELARRVDGIDIMFCGDIHVGYQEPWVDPVTHVPCFQGYGRGTNVHMIEFVFDTETKTLVEWKPFQDQGVLVTLMADRFPRDRKVAETIDTSVARVETGFNDRIGTATAPITRNGETETAMGNLVCDAMLWRLKGDMAITNKGGVRTDLPSGNITPRDVFNVLPFDNTLGAVTVSGKFLKDLMEDKVAYGGSGLYVAGVKVKIDRTRPRGERVVLFEIGGKPYEAEKDYRLVTTDYLLEGNSGMEKLAGLRSQSAIESGVYMRDSVIEYIREKALIEPHLDGRWQYVDKN